MSTRPTTLAHLAAFLDPGLVRINEAAINALQPDLSTFSVAQERLPFSPVEPKDAIAYLLAQTALQYRFWDGDGSTYTRYAVGDKVGSTAMVASFQKAWGPGSSPGPAILDCARASDAADPQAAARMLAPHFGAIPDPFSRVHILDEVLRYPDLGAVVDLLDGCLRNNRAGVEEAALLASIFPLAYGDAFLKKAQLAITLMAAQYQGCGVAITPHVFAFADYQVPAVMRHLGILEYSEDLAAKVDARHQIKKGSAEELAIRAATVFGCERFSAQHEISAAQTDWYFWLRRKEPVAPFHLTDTTEY